MDEARHAKTAASTGTVVEISHVVRRRNTWIRFILAQRYSKNTKHSNDVNNPFDESLQERSRRSRTKIHNTAPRNWQTFWKNFDVEVRMLWAREYFEWIISQWAGLSEGRCYPLGLNGRPLSQLIISCHARPHPMTRHHVGIVKQVVLPQANDLNQRASTK